MKTEQEAAEYCGVTVEVFRQLAEDNLEPVSEYDNTGNGTMYTAGGVDKVRELCINADLTKPPSDPPMKKEAAKASKPKGGKPAKKEAAKPAVKAAPVKPVVTIVVTRARLLNTQMVMGELDGRKVGVKLQQPGHLANIVEGCTLQARHLQFDTYVAVSYPARRGLNAPLVRG